MKHLTIVNRGTHFEADDQDMPGSPPVGRGKSELEAVGSWFYNHCAALDYKIVVAPQKSCVLHIPAERLVRGDYVAFTKSADLSVDVFGQVSAVRSDRITVNHLHGGHKFTMSKAGLCVYEKSAISLVFSGSIPEPVVKAGYEEAIAWITKAIALHNAKN